MARFIARAADPCKRVDFAFEELERLGEDVSQFRRKDLLKKCVASWCMEMQARPMEGLCFK